MKNSIYDVLVSPLFSEKAVAGNEIGKYFFKITPGANKGAVKAAVRKIFGVEPKKISIISIPARRRKFKGIQGVKSGFKKAIVTLGPDVVIDLHNV
jgi:large subunit ribosomal protein L23